MKKFYHKKTWFDARSSCRSYGAELVMVVSYGESNFMKGYLRHTGIYLKVPRRECFNRVYKHIDHATLLKIPIWESANFVINCTYM